MNKLFIGYYIKPHIWMGNKVQRNSTEIAYYEENFVSNIDLAIQRQGLVIAGIDYSVLPDFLNNNVNNLLQSDIASFCLVFFNALSFSIYDAHLIKYDGAFQSIPQIIQLSDLFLWPQEDIKKIDDLTMVQPIPIQAFEANTMQDMVIAGMKSIGHIDNQDFQM